MTYDWPLVVLKELMDNGLDGSEEAEIAPVISIAVGNGSTTIPDNGGGIETETIESILDYTIRVSSREAYVSPTRGAQGNALKTILAMGYVLDREREDVCGGGDVHREPRRQASHRVPGRSRHQPAQDHAQIKTDEVCGTQTGGTGAGIRAEAPLARNPAATVVSLGI